MFKVLVIAFYYPPLGLSGVQRTLKFTKYFSNFNWQPTVITSGSVNYFAYDESLLKEVEDANVRIIRTEALTPGAFLLKKGKTKPKSTFIQSILSKISKTIFIPDNKIFWAKKASKIALNLVKKEKFDAIFVTVPPFSSLVAITKLKAKLEIPIFADYRDAWVTNQYRFYPTPYHRYLHKKLEDRCLRKIDRVIVVNRIIKEDIIKNFPFLKFNDIQIIPHGYDPEDFSNLIKYPKENDKMVILFAGAFYEGITPNFLLKAFKRLTIEQPDIAANIELHFVGNLKRENSKLIHNLKLEKFVKEIGYLNHLETVRRIISSDVLWLMLPDNGKMYNVTPGKIYEYFAAKKPIIANLPEGIAKNLLLEYKASFITSTENIEEIKTALITIHNLFAENKLPKPSDEFITKFDRVSQTEQLVKLFQFHLKAE